MNMSEEPFGIRIKKQRLNQRLSLQDLALLSGVSLHRIFQIESYNNQTEKEKDKLEKVLGGKHELQ